MYNPPPEWLDNILECALLLCGIAGILYVVMGFFYFWEAIGDWYEKKNDDPKSGAGTMIAYGIGKFMLIVVLVITILFIGGTLWNMDW